MKNHEDVLQDHFLNPRNVGEMTEADGVGNVGNPLCGDLVRLFIQIKNGRVVKSAFKAFGCRTSIATSSILTEKIKGMSVDELLQITETDVSKFLGSLPPMKQHCAKLGVFALQSAIGDHRRKTTGDATLFNDIAARTRDVREWRELKPVSDPDLIFTGVD